MRTELLGGSFVALSAVQFGAVVIFGTIAGRAGLPVIGVLSMRFAIAALLLGSTAKARGLSLRPAAGEAVPLALLGSLGYAVEASFFFLAIARGTASAVTLLFFVYPAIVMLLSMALRMAKPSPMVIAALVTSMSGAAVVVASSGGIDITGTGIALAVASAATFAFYLIGAERTLRATPSIVGATWTSGSAALVLGAYVVVARAGEIPDGADWWPVIAMGVGTAGAFAALFEGLRRLGAVRTSIIAALEPLTTAALAILFLDEPIRAGIIGGGALILGGAVAASLARGRHVTEAVP